MAESALERNGGRVEEWSGWADRVEVQRGVDGGTDNGDGGGSRGVDRGVKLGWLVERLAVESR